MKSSTINSLFEYLGFHLRKEKRFLIPIFIVVLVKILVFTWIQLSINWRPDNFSIKFWWETFTMWDGGWYNLIAKHGYETIPLASVIPMQQTFAFQPLFPATIKGLGLIVGNFDSAQVVLSSVFGILWIPIFQLVAEQYFDSEQALSITIVTSLFPTIFIFTSVGYSEGLFLIFVLSAYYLYLKKRPLYTTVLVTLASLTRLTS